MQCKIYFLSLFGCSWHACLYVYIHMDTGAFLSCVYCAWLCSIKIALQPLLNLELPWYTKDWLFPWVFFRPKLETSSGQVRNYILFFCVSSTCWALHKHRADGPVLNLQESGWLQVLLTSPRNTKQLTWETNQAACTHIKAGTLSAATRPQF